MNKKVKDSLRMIYLYNTFAFIGVLLGSRWGWVMLVVCAWLLLACYEVGKINKELKK